MEKRVMADLRHVLLGKEKSPNFSFLGFWKPYRIRICFSNFENLYKKKTSPFKNWYIVIYKEIWKLIFFYFFQTSETHNVLFYKI